MTNETVPLVRLRIMVLGAGGRAGRAITHEAANRGHEVVAVVRDPRRHSDLAGDGVTVVAGDALDTRSVAAVSAGCSAIVSAVTPFTAPPESFDGFDTGYYTQVADALLAAASSGARRVIVVSLFATLDTPGGGPVMDDLTLFPPALRPFAAAHAAGTARLAASTRAVDWLALAPPPQLLADAPRTGSYQLGSHTVDEAASARPLSYADLAVAIIDQIEQPTHHREHIALYGT